MDRAARLVAAAAMPADGPTEGPFGPRVFGAPMPLGFAGFVPNVFWPLPAGFVPNVGDVPKLGGRPGVLLPGAPGIPGRVDVFMVKPGRACSSSGERYRKSPLVIGS